MMIEGQVKWRTRRCRRPPGGVMTDEGGMISGNLELRIRVRRTVRSRSGYCRAATAEAACLMRAATAAGCEM